MKTATAGEMQQLENYRIAFINMEKVGEIKLRLGEYGYDQEKINEGKSLYERAQSLFDKNKKTTADARHAYELFQMAYKEVKDVYNNHRKKAKVALMDNPELFVVFDLKGLRKDRYIEWLHSVRTFYEQAQNNVSARPMLEVYKINKEAIDEQWQRISKMQLYRAEYERKRGESQDATRLKNQSLEDIKQWMNRFYTIARVVLEDRPQLLEAVMKFVRSTRN